MLVEVAKLLSREFIVIQLITNTRNVAREGLEPAVKSVVPSR